MMKQMKRTVYEAPVTERFQVELEGVFCASAEVTNGNKDLAGINDQDINTGFTTDFSTKDETNVWDSE